MANILHCPKIYLSIYLSIYLLSTLLSTVPPVSATLSAPSPLVAGSRYNVSCSALGSSPFVLYNWTLAGDTEPDTHVRIARYRH